MAVACACTVAFAVCTVVVRPLDGSEGNFLFDAARIRHGLPLYVDPRAGAWDYGPVPSRYYVLYAPFWAAAIAAFPPSMAATLARAVSMTAWVGFLVGVVATAPRASRWVTAAGAAFVASLYPLMLFAASGRPDAIAVAMVGVAVLRSVRRGRVGPTEGALFALAPFFKPNVVAAAIGTMAADLVERRGRAWPGVAGAASCALVCAGALEVASGGAWVEHLVASTWMPFSARLWLEQVTSRGPFFALPLAFCAWCAGKARAKTALCALASSVAWTAWSLAKIGSASNYWMEPCAVGVVILATVPVPRVPAWLRAAAGPLALAQVAWTGVAAVRSSIEAMGVAVHRCAVLAGVRAECGATADDVVLADEAGLEEMLDGRVTEQPLVLTQLVRRGLFPIGTWVDDVRRPEVRCLVMQSDWLERGEREASPEHDLLPAALRSPLRARFTLVGEHAGLWVYRAR
jgi:hypothetical protein